jgi:hypothetical protein
MMIASAIIEFPYTSVLLVFHHASTQTIYHDALPNPRWPDLGCSGNVVQ